MPFKQEETSKENNQPMHKSNEWYDDYKLKNLLKYGLDYI